MSWLGFGAGATAISESRCACHPVVMPVRRDPWGVIPTAAIGGELNPTLNGEKRHARILNAEVTIRDAARFSP